MTAEQTVPPANPEPLLDVHDLHCEINIPAGPLQVLRGVDLRVYPGQTVGIVGESGSGKSMLLKSMLGLLPASARLSGHVHLAGADLRQMPSAERSRFLGSRVGVVFQNPMTSLNPVVPISRQMSEASRFHLGLSKKQAKALALELLQQVGIPNAAKRLDDYPHQFSGGMRQRVMIAMALTCEPSLLVTDEATTALDVTIQKEILDLLQRLQRDRNMAMVLVSHDLSVVSGRSDEVHVMYGGKVLEKAPTGTLFPQHRHQYTRALLRAIPRLDRPQHERLQAIPGRPPNVLDPPPGCPFAARCGEATDQCHTEWPPPSTGAGEEHVYHCWVPVEHTTTSRSTAEVGA